MARTALTVQDISVSGMTPSYTAAIVDGHSFPNNKPTFIHVKNGAGSDVTITIQTALTKEGLDLADRTVTVTAGSETMIGPFSDIYNQSDGSVYVDYSATASVTIAAISLS